MQTILVTGGAGFIGSHTCVVLLENNFRVVVIDSFVNSSYNSLKRVHSIVGTKLHDLKKRLFIYEGDLRNKNILNKVFDDFYKMKKPINAVVHFAGLKAVSDSIKNPQEYWDVNVNGSLNLFQIMEKYQCRKIVFSSSATVYDHSFNDIMNEKTALNPTNPYGQTKLEIERILKDIYFKNENNWNVIVLRYFNPIGAHPSGLLGEDPQNNPTNLFPLLIEAASSNDKSLEIFGNDWPTNDGTCIRDFIHVMDLAEAHYSSLIHMDKKRSDFLILNVGTGKGTTVLELIKVFEQENNCKIPFKFVKRRTGDKAKSIADNRLILSTLGWINKRDLNDMCKDGWNWKKKNPNGYL